MCYVWGGNVVYSLMDRKFQRPKRRPLKEYFEDEVRPSLVPIMLGKNNFPKLSGKSIYFAVKLIC